MPERILIAEDEAAIADAVQFALEREGYTVDAVDDGGRALEAAQERRHDVLVLDLLLPTMSGIDVCRRVRADANPVPILMLTAKDTELDRVLGLEVGADDYVTKPFSIAELVARIRALVRRRELDRHEGGVRLRAGGLEVDLGKHQATVDGRTVALTSFELKLLALLAAEPERVFSRREIMRHLWDSAYVADERACDLHVSNIRRKIEPDPANPQRLLTVRGAGYKLQPV